MSDTKPQAWCPFWLKAHIGGEGICPRLKGAHEALADLMREIQEEREAREEAEKALDAVINLFSSSADCPEICPMLEAGDCTEYAPNCNDALKVWAKAQAQEVGKE